MVAPSRLVFDIVPGYVVNLGMSSRQSRSGRDMRPVRAERSPWSRRGPAAPPSNRFRPAGLRRRIASDLRAFAVEPLPTCGSSPSNRPLARDRPNTGTVPTPEPSRRGACGFRWRENATRRERNSEGVKFWKGQDAAESCGTRRWTGIWGLVRVPLRHV